ncbi:hypothetical protein BAY59_27170 [Prauserella coralliicola]|nr:hypothetical protein BAY59_27170 [Prauserella coralliicola]
MPPLDGESQSARRFPKSPPVLVLQGIRKAFAGVPVLHGIDLTVRRGEIVALLGENGAGKSTLVKMIVGLESPDTGRVVLDGKEQPRMTPLTAHELGIRYISQEIADAGTLPVDENISLGHLPNRFGFVCWKAVRERTRKVFEELRVDFPLDHRAVGDLRLGERQLIEIARAVSDDVRLLILDEPTAALPDDEVDRLLGLLRELRDRGVGMVYITHRLDEVRRLADSVHVMRDGHTVLRSTRSGTDETSIVKAMVGERAVDDASPARRRRNASGVEPSIELEYGSVTHAFEPLTVRAYPGEVLMLYGKLGSGATEVVRAFAGDLPLDRGVLRVDGRIVRRPTPHALVRSGVGLVPIDRGRDGLFLSLSVMQNLASTSWRRLASRTAFIRGKAERAAYDRWSERLRFTNIASPASEVSTLSGGNQQKVMLGRWLEYGVSVLALLEPTRGVDIASRREIYAVLRGLTAEGKTVLAATSDVEEVVQCADRALVLSRGKIVGELRGDDITAETLTRLAVA